jgi:DNA invertase Pin-like site-specific DNA recombinase
MAPRKVPRTRTARGTRTRTAEGPLRVLGYVRVSTDKQVASGAGLEAQREAIQRACEQRGYHLLEIVEEHNGISAKSLERPGIVRALAELDAGRADALVVAKLDRLSRSLKDFAGLMDRARTRGWAIVALDAPVDTTTAMGEGMANMVATFAQIERRLIGERTKAAMDVKRAQGARFGRPVSLPDAVVRRIVRARGRGMTLRAIADMLNRDGVPTGQGGAKWWAETVRGVLRRVERGRAQ